MAAAGGATAERIGATAVLGLALVQRGGGAGSAGSPRRVGGALRAGADPRRRDRDPAHRRGLARTGSASTCGAGVANRHARRWSRLSVCTRPIRTARSGCRHWRSWLSPTCRTDVISASRCAAEALAEATGSARLPALLAAGRTALGARRDPDRRGSCAAQAVEHARQAARTLLAGRGPRASRRGGHRGRADVDAGGPPDLVRGWSAPRRRPGAGPPRPAQSDLVARPARRATRRRPPRSRRGPRAHSRRRVVAGRVLIATFGRFEVLVDGVVVPPEAWQSRRARELLRLLVCRRGRTVPRLEICEVLWPDDDPLRTTHRLSVLLSIVRGIVGADALVADQVCVALDHSRVAGGRRALPHRRRRRPRPARARGGGRGAHGARRGGAPLHRRALRRHPVRRRDDRAPGRGQRGAAGRATVAWPRSCRQAGEFDWAAAYLRRLLAEDRYDEEAHRCVARRTQPVGSARPGPGRGRLAIARRWPRSDSAQPCSPGSISARRRS